MGDLAAPPTALCFPRGLRPPDPPTWITPNMSPLGHDECTVIIVHACTMIIVHACTMIIVHAWITITVHACTFFRRTCMCYDHSTCWYYGHSTCMHYDHSTSMYYDHSTCMYYDHSTCMYYAHSTCMYYDHSTCVSYGHSTWCIMTNRDHAPWRWGRWVWGGRSPREAGGFGGAPGSPMLFLWGDFSSHRGDFTIAKITDTK